MATAYNKTTAQSYPRITDETDKFNGYLDDSLLVQHVYKIPKKQVKGFIKAAITYANEKSGRAILNIPDDLDQEEVNKIYVKEGKKLFRYFKSYCGDPASTAFDLQNRNYKEICNQQFYNRTLQKERMNSGWRYQHLISNCANHSKRFVSVSDIGTAEADFNAVIAYASDNKKHLTLYVSVKNRSNTMGGQDWPKAIYALEGYAKGDKNRKGPYCCIFGIAMDRGLRLIRCSQQTKQPYSVNTEVWRADYFWPFFSNYSYSEIMTLVLNTLIEIETPGKVQTTIVPDLLIESFGKCCKEAGLINEEGLFDDPIKLVSFFCE